MSDVLLFIRARVEGAINDVLADTSSNRDSTVGLDWAFTDEDSIDTLFEY